VLNQKSSDKKKDKNSAEKEPLIHFRFCLLKTKTINANFLLKSYQPIHSTINIIVDF